MAPFVWGDVDRESASERSAIRGGLNHKFAIRKMEAEVTVGAGPNSDFRNGDRAFDYGKKSPFYRRSGGVHDHSLNGGPRLAHAALSPAIHPLINSKTSGIIRGAELAFTLTLVGVPPTP